MALTSDTVEAQLLAADTEDVAALRIIGRANFKVSGEFREFGLRAVRGERRALILDFGQCVSVDSTILGVIAMIGLEGRGTTAVIAANADEVVQKQLLGVGLKKLLTFADAENGGQFDWSSLCEAAAGSVDTAQVADTMLDAHEALMNLDERNIPVFRDVVELLKDQAESDT